MADETEVEDEILSLQSIYDEDDVLVYVNEQGRKCLLVTVRSSNGISGLQIKLEIMIPANYPNELPPLLSFTSSDCLSDEEQQQLKCQCESSFIQNEVVIYQWLEIIKDYLTDKAAATASQDDSTKGLETSSSQGIIQLLPTTDHRSPSPSTSEAHTDSTRDDEEGTMHHGEPFTDRKSTFQAHVASIHSHSELERKLKHLKSNKKIQGATHNILAFRYFDSLKNVLVQDCDDDGESAAGGRLLHLLQIMDVSNVMVVVSRWYGGIHLGPDRFKHINNVARILLVSSNLVEQKKDGAVKGKAKQKRKH